MSRVVASYVNSIQKENAHDSQNKNMAFVGMNFKLFYALHGVVLLLVVSYV
jgi:hypothetical protein